MRTILCDKCRRSVDRDDLLPHNVEVRFYHDSLREVFARPNILDFCYPCFVEIKAFLTSVKK